MWDRVHSARDRMVTLLGTGHVFDLRRRVQEEIFRRHPTLVCLELDPPRFRALSRPKEARAKAPLHYQVLADFQKRIAAEYGVEAGDEMLAAAQAARDIRVPVALIDVDAQATFRRLFREMRFLEKARLVASALVSPFLAGRKVEEQLAEMQSDYASYFEALGKQFPTVKRVLLDERNEHMARAIAGLAASHPSLVAVVGDGHVDGMRALLEAGGTRVETVRLAELRRSPETARGNAQVTVSYAYDE